MRKIILTLLILLAIGIFAPAALHANEITVTIDGQPVTFEGQGLIIIDGRTLVPVRGVFEHLGFNFSWNGETQTTTISRGGLFIDITIGSTAFAVNGAAHALDVPAQIIDGRTLVPIRLPLESAGYALDWDETTATVIITSVNEADVAPPPTGSITVINPQTQAVATANESGVRLTGPVLLTQEEIRSMLPFAWRPGDHIAGVASGGSSCIR